MNHLAGGRIFPGEHHLADFHVTDGDGEISMEIQAPRRQGHVGETLRLGERGAARRRPASTRWRNRPRISRAEAWGYSFTRDCCAQRRMAFCLVTETRSVRPLAVEEIESSFFLQMKRSFRRAESVTFDHAARR